MREARTAWPRRPPLDEALSTPEGKRAYVRRLFATIAPRYDLITVLLSCGQDRRWKRRLARMASPRPSERALDLACGTGDITCRLAERGAWSVGLDITPGMLERARGKPLAERHGIRFVAGDMLTLPFPDAAFDIVTAGYGLRNVPHLPGALAEILRVLKPGGRFLSLDFNRPANAAVRAVYLAYLEAVGACLGRVLHGDPDTYRYIPASIRRYPGAHGVCDMARGAGFAHFTWTPVLGGLMAIHRGLKQGPCAGG